MHVGAIFTHSSHVTLSQSASKRRNQEKKEHKPLRTSRFSQRNVSAMFDNHTIMLF